MEFDQTFITREQNPDFGMHEQKDLVELRPIHDTSQNIFVDNDELID